MNFDSSKQNDGFWFGNVGGIGYKAEFAYRITYTKGNKIHLLQNGKYM